MPSEVAVDPAPFGAAAEYAQSLIGWCLLIFGGTALAFLQSSYRRPDSRKWRFVLACPMPFCWASLGFSIYYGLQARGVHLSALFGARVSRTVLMDSIQDDLIQQRFFIETAIALAALWLLIDMAIWIFQDDPLPSGRKRR